MTHVHTDDCVALQIQGVHDGVCAWQCHDGKLRNRFADDNAQGGTWPQRLVDRVDEAIQRWGRHVCDWGHFDRTVCPDPCGGMHSYCTVCGRRADPCAHDQGGES